MTFEVKVVAATVLLAINSGFNSNETALVLDTSI